jgi:hypothetical protein
MTPEGKVKKHLRKECEKRGWYCLALEARSVKGWPDNTILIPSRQGRGRVVFIEVKEPNARTDVEHLNRQLAVLGTLTSYGYPAYLCNSKESVDCTIKLIERSLAE